MEGNSVLSCRGCLAELSSKEAHSFEWPEIKNIFVECTGIQVLPEQQDLPQQVCFECLYRCEQWKNFKSMCHKVNKQLLETTANPVVPEDHEDHDIIDIQESWDMDNDGEDDLGLYSFGELIEDPVEVLDIIAMDDDTEELTPDNSSDLKCPVCKSWIPESTHLRHHLKEHYSNEDPQCPICAEKFTRGSKVYPHVIAVHMQGHTESGLERPNRHTQFQHSPANVTGPIESCPLCKTRCNEMRIHIMDVHVPSGQDTCPICNKQFEKRSKLKQHLLVHTKEKPVGCTQCTKRFAGPYSLKMHNIRYHGQERNDSKMFKCPLCYKYYYLCDLRRHFVVHTKERPYKCAYCSLDYTWKEEVKKHIQQKHVGRSVEKGFQLKEGSIFHNPNPWEEMGYSLDKDHVGMTEQPSRTERRRFPKCNQCKQQFGNILLLKAHTQTHGKRTTHPFHCKECGNSFTNKKLLKRHASSHSDERPFVCSICGSAFKNKNTLTRHTNVIHPNRIDE